MSGFIPDLANWALRGGAGENEENNDDSNNNNSSSNSSNNNRSNETLQPQLSEQEVRARRMARVEAMQRQLQESQQSPKEDPMQVDPPAAAAAATETTPMEISNTSPPRTKPVTSPPKDQLQQRKRKTSSKITSPVDPSRKLQRKKEILIKKVLNVTFESNAADPAAVVIELDKSDSIGVHTIAELLATRLSLSPDDLQTVPQQKPLILYLAQAHRKAGEELKVMRQASKPKTDSADLQAILQEIQNQVVSYAASSLMEPDLFEQAKDGTSQLSKALIHSTLDPMASITFGVSGNTSSFYYLMCEELYVQDMAAFQRVIQTVANEIVSELRKCDSIESGVGESTALALVAALTALCSNKKAALTMTQMEKFLVPSADSPSANDQIRPPMPAGDFLRMLAGENRPYLKRSGTAVEKQTILGACLRISSPKNNPAFSAESILRQSLDSVERASNTQRRSLKLYQDNFNSLIMALIKAGAEARGKVSQTGYTNPSR